MDQLLIAGVAIVVAVGIAVVLRRRESDVPTAPTAYPVPAQLDRSDFDRPESPWLVAVFSSSTCLACADTWEKASVLASDDVAVQEVEATARRDLHERYRVEAVPMVLIADAEGVVRASFLGPLTATDLWATVAEVRTPGSTPDGCDHGQGATPPGAPA
jgi:hypothetical protein